MKKLIALTAASVMASSAAVAAVSLSGTASVTYTEGTNDITSAASMTIKGTSGGTSMQTSVNLLTGTAGSASMSTSIGPVSVSVDMTNDAEAAGVAAVDERGITLGLDVLAGDVSISLDQKGKATLSTTVAGVKITHALGGATSASASLAGMDINLKKDGATTTWDVSTTLNGVTLKIDNAGAVTAAMGLAGNKVTIANATATGTKVTVARDLTSGASLEAAYATSGNVLTLKASVSF